MGIFGPALGLLLFPFFQAGDHGKKQVDPIPAAKIPPAPVLSQDQALASFHLPEGYRIESVLGAGLTLDKPVAFSFDAGGRVWVVEMRSYMPDLDGNGEGRPEGRIRVLEDRDGDGLLDHSTTFLKGLVLPRAIAPLRDGLLFTNGEALFFQRRKGLQAVGEPELVDREYARGGNPEHKANGLLRGIDNWFYSAKSRFRYRSHFEGEGAKRRRVWERQRTSFRGQWGLSQDAGGRLFTNNNSIPLILERTRPGLLGEKTFARPLGGNRVFPMRMTPGVNRAYLKGILDRRGFLRQATSTCAPLVFLGRGLGKENRGGIFVCEPAAYLLLAFRIDLRDPSKPKAHRIWGETKKPPWDFLCSSDERFRPVALATGPDGCLWVLDMHIGPLQHRTYMTTYLRKQYKSRGLDRFNQNQGRLYRIRSQTFRPSPFLALEKLPLETLPSMLCLPEGWYRFQAQSLLVDGGGPSLFPALRAMVGGEIPKLGRLHALWTLEGMGGLCRACLETALRDPDPDVRGSALELLDRVKGTFALQRVSRDPSSLPSLVFALASQARRFPSSGEEDGKLLAQILRANPGDKVLRLAAQQGGKVLESPVKKKATKSKNPPLPPHILPAFKKGKLLFEGKASCLSCHGKEGRGMPNLAPPLRNSEWVLGDPKRLVRVLLHGLAGPLQVAGRAYRFPSVMPGFGGKAGLEDQDLAFVATYVRNAWGNRGSLVRPEFVTKVRKQTKARGDRPYSPKDLSNPKAK